MLSLRLDVSSILNTSLFYEKELKFPEFSIYSSPRTLEAVDLPFNAGSSSTIVSFYWLVSSGHSPHMRL